MRLKKKKKEKKVLIVLLVSLVLLISCSRDAGDHTLLSIHRVYRDVGVFQASAVLSTVIISQWRDLLAVFL